MKRGNLRISTLIALPFMLFTIGIASDPDSGKNKPKPKPAACVICANVGGCLRCVSKDSGGNSCMTSGDCQSCSIFEVCPSLGDKPVKEDQRVLLPLSDETIREIAAVHPRFAATLARIRNVPVSSGTHQVYWTPVGFTAKDVERYITPQDQSKALSQSQQEAVRRANLEVEEGKLTNISYLVTVNALDASSGRLILEVTSGSYLDPAYSGLELRYTNDKVEWRVF